MCTGRKNRGGMGAQSYDKRKTTRKSVGCNGRNIIDTGHCGTGHRSQMR